MALAIKFQEMVDHGEVCDYAELARLGYVTRARITQIMNLLNLAPEIQEDILVATAALAKLMTTEGDCVQSRSSFSEQIKFALGRHARVNTNRRLCERL